MIFEVADFRGNVKEVLKKAAKSRSGSFMSRDFARPSDLTKQLAVCAALGFGRKFKASPSDIIEIEKWLRNADKAIGKKYGASDFKTDRLSRAARHDRGIEMSRRQYNKRFRLAARMEAKAAKMAKEQFKRTLALASKNRLASHIDEEMFTKDANTACFIAYYVARCNLR